MSFSRNSIRLEFEGDATFLKNQKLVQNYEDHDGYVEIYPVEKVSIKQIIQEAIKDADISKF